MLHLNHLKKSFGKNEILTDIEYTFEEGNIYPVLGEQEEQLCLSVSQEILL
jgi:ABC-type multidrug transport system ATPase subunit